MTLLAPTLDFLVTTDEGISQVVTVARPNASEMMVSSGEGLSLVTTDSVINLPFLVVTDSGINQLNIEFVETGPQTYVGDLADLLAFTTTIDAVVGVVGDFTAQVITVLAPAASGLAGDMTASITLTLDTGASAGHGVRGPWASAVPMVASLSGDRGVSGDLVFGLLTSGYTGVLVLSGDLDTPLSFATTMDGGSGLSGALEITSPVTINAEALGGSGASGDLSGTVSVGVFLSASFDAVGGHGVAGSLSISVPIMGSVLGVVERYNVVGQVRLNGGLVDRQIRVYSRATGELLGQGATVGGLFTIHAGFVEQECYLIPIHLSTGATDFFPPCSNRVMNIPAVD